MQHFTQGDDYYDPLLQRRVTTNTDVDAEEEKD